MCFWVAIEMFLRLLFSIAINIPYRGKMPNILVDIEMQFGDHEKGDLSASNLGCIPMTSFDGNRMSIKELAYFNQCPKMDIGCRLSEDSKTAL